MNASEQSMTCRKANQPTSKPDSVVDPGQTQTVPVYGLGGVRRRGCMNLIQALVWNVGTCWLNAKGREAPMSSGFASDRYTLIRTHFLKYSTEKKVYLMTNKTRKIYTGEFKAAAVKLVAEGKQSAPEASKSLGIGESTLYKWIDQLKPGDEKDSKSIKVNDELQRLRSEVIELKKKLALAEEHREILIPTRGT